MPPPQRCAHDRAAEEASRKLLKAYREYQTKVKAWEQTPDGKSGNVRPPLELDAALIGIYRLLVAKISVEFDALEKLLQGNAAEVKLAAMGVMVYTPLLTEHIRRAEVMERFMDAKKAQEN